MTDIQQILFNKALESLQAATLLLAQGLNDSSSSRAYYAMFYIAQMILLEDDLSFSKHSAVIAAFGQHFAKPERVDRKFHSYLIKGMEQRHVGDYALDSVTAEGATVQLERAEEFVELARKYFNIES